MKMLLERFGGAKAVPLFLAIILFLESIPTAIPDSIWLASPGAAQFPIIDLLELQ